MFKSVTSQCNFVWLWKKCPRRNLFFLASKLINIKSFWTYLWIFWFVLIYFYLFNFLLLSSISHCFLFSLNISIFFIFAVFKILILSLIKLVFWMIYQCPDNVLLITLSHCVSKIARKFMIKDFALLCNWYSSKPMISCCHDTFYFSIS